MRSLHRLGLTLLLAGCTSDVRASREAIEYGWSYDAPLDRFYYSVPKKAEAQLPHQRASGTLYVDAIDDRGNRLVNDESGIPLHRPCGVTFVSNSFAVTAAHCVDATQVPDPASDTLTVELYAPGSPYQYQQAMKVGGLAFPDYSHPSTFTGHHVETYECRVVMRCGTEFDSAQYNCPPGHSTADIALLKCDDRPGCDFAHVAVAQSERSAYTVQMGWAHEIYDVAQAPPDFHEHYSVLHPNEIGENFHFFDDPLHPQAFVPLRSTEWPRPTPYLINDPEDPEDDVACLDRPLAWPNMFPGDRILLDPASVVVTPGFTRDVRWTELLGCQDGGAGVVQRSFKYGTLDLLGPVSTGTISMDGSDPLLCHDPTQFSCVAGQNRGLAYTRLTHTRAITNPSYVTDLTQSCNNLASAVLWLPSGAHQLAEVASGTATLEDYPAPWPCPTCSAWDAHRIYNEPMARLVPGGRLTLTGSALSRGTRYRLSMRVRSMGASVPLITVRAGTQVLASAVAPVTATGESAGLVSIVFAAEASGTQSIEITASGTAGVTELALVEDAAVNGFESYADRHGGGLRQGATLEPMRFVAGTGSRFAALLLGGERFVWTRQAFAAGRGPWSVDFDASIATSGMRCGFVLSNGTETSVACDASGGTASATLRPAAALVPVAFFIELPRAHADVAVDDLRVRSAP